MPLAYVSEMLGHAQLTTTSRYIQASRLGMQAILKRVEPKRNVKREAVAHALHKASDVKGVTARKSLSNKERALSSVG
jgi:hypothetical protein